MPELGLTNTDNNAARIRRDKFTVSSLLLEPLGFGDRANISQLQ